MIKLIVTDICPGCRQIEAFIQQQDIHGITVLKGYEGEGKELAIKHMIRSVPSLILNSGQVLVGNNPIKKYLSHCAVCGGPVGKQRHCDKCNACSIG